MTKIKITKIEWDFSNESEKNIKIATKHLPSVPFYMNVDIDQQDKDDDLFMVMGCIADKHDWMVKDCEYSIVK